MIVSPTLLPVRDTAIHEAAHFVIGQSLGIPCQPPIISQDRQSGYVQPDLQPLPPGTNKAVFLAQFDPQQVRKAAMSRAVFCLAGFAAEARLQHSHWAAHRIIGGGSSDLQQAQTALADAGCTEADLWICWQRARLAVDRHWQAIMDLAGTL